MMMRYIITRWGLRDFPEIMEKLPGNVIEERYLQEALAIMIFELGEPRINWDANRWMDLRWNNGHTFSFRRSTEYGN